MAFRRLLLGSGCVTLAMGCNQLMGIEQAQVDPSLLRAESTIGTGGSTSTSGQGGSNSVGETSGPSGSGGSVMATSDRDTTTTGAAGESGTDADPGGGKNGTNASATASSGGQAASSTSQGQAPTLCDSYCDDMTEFCTDTNLQYRDRNQCMAICSLFPEGSLGDTASNSAACRAKFAGDARYGSGTELGAYCRRAGAGGGNRCGSTCQGLCSIMMHVCTQESAGVYHFADIDECLSACETVPDLATGYSASDPTIADGNSVQCRLFHVMSAAMLDPLEHCQHAMGVTLCEVPASE